MRRLLLFGVLLVGVLSGLVERGTYASFTSSAAGAANQFTAGTVILGATIANGDTLTVSNLVPGDTITARLSITNTGNLDLRYAMTSTVTGDATLGSTLQLTIWKNSSTCATYDAGTVVYSQAALSGAAFGNPTQGSQAGDRTLSVATPTEDLCFRVTLPPTTTTTLQGTSVTATFGFRAEQLSGT